MPSMMTGQKDVAALVQALGEIGPEVRKNLSKEFKTAAGPVAADARRRASWSTRIPGAIKVRAGRSRARPGALIATSTKIAPHARLYEFGSGRNRKLFRHPVHGNREVWVAQETRPYIIPAVQDNAGEFMKAGIAAVDAAAKKHGLT